MGDRGGGSKQHGTSCLDMSLPFPLLQLEAGNVSAEAGSKAFDPLRPQSSGRCEVLSLVIKAILPATMCVCVLSESLF